MDWKKYLTLATLAGALTVGAGSEVRAQDDRERDGEDVGVVTDEGWNDDRDEWNDDRDDAAVATVPSGTDIPITLEEDIPIERDRFDDSFEARVTRDVTVRGDVVIPEGAAATVRLVEDDDDPDRATLRLAEVRVEGEMRDVNTETARADTKRDRAGTGKKTGIGAAAGAVVGAVTGVGVVKGAVLGAGGGLAWGLLGGRTREIGKGTQLGFELQDDLEVR